MSSLSVQLNPWSNKKIKTKKRAHFSLAQGKQLDDKNSRECVLPFMCYPYKSIVFFPSRPCTITSFQNIKLSSSSSFSNAFARNISHIHLRFNNIIKPMTYTYEHLAEHIRTEKKRAVNIELSSTPRDMFLKTVETAEKHIFYSVLLGHDPENAVLNSRNRLTSILNSCTHFSNFPLDFPPNFNFSPTFSISDRKILLITHH